MVILFRLIVFDDDAFHAGHRVAFGLTEHVLMVGKSKREVVDSPVKVLFDIHLGWAGCRWTVRPVSARGDASEVFKKKALKAKKRKDFLEKATFFLLIVLAALVVIGVFFAYTVG